MTTWTRPHTNPFAAIKEAATNAGKPQDYNKALSQLARSADWETFDSVNYLDELLQEIAGATNIVCQYSLEGLTTHYRACYDL